MEKHVQIINIQLEDTHSPKSQSRTLPASQKPSFCPLTSLLAASFPNVITILTYYATHYFYMFNCIIVIIQWT